MILHVPPTLRGSRVAHVPFFQAQLMEVQKLLSRHGVSTSNYGREGPCLKEGKKNEQIPTGFVGRRVYSPTNLPQRSTIHVGKYTHDLLLLVR